MEETVTKIADAAKGAEWLLAAAILVVPIVQIVKKTFGKKLVAYLDKISGKRGAWILAIATGALLNGAQAVARGETPSGAAAWVRLIIAGSVAGLTAAGLYDGKTKKKPAEPPPTPVA